jgi:ABC-type transporter Mla MlaB component
LLNDRGMVLRIDRTTDAEFVVLTLSGHLALDDMQGLRRLVKSESAQALILDLGDVIQVDREAIALLSSFTAAGVELRRCPAHIVASMAGRPKEPT